MTPAQLGLALVDTERPPAAIVKRCSCGLSYDADGWSRLPLCGIQDLGVGERMELRNCPCGSTIGMELPPESDPRPNSPEDLGGWAPPPPTAKRRGPTFEIPAGTPARSCRSCAAIIFWIVTTTGRKMPVDPDGVSHFATCVDAPRWRKR